nr:GspL/Epsl periplasmic domain-containing protein [Escherichia coli]
MQQQLGRTRSQQEYQQALWYSASAESLALSALSLSLKNEKRVHLAQPWASGPRFFPLPQGQIAVTLRDAQACFNLNALAQAEEQFLTLFPEQKRIVNLRSQVTMALKKYRPQADDTRLLAELSAIASTLKSASLSDIEMRGFTFDQKRQILHLQLRAANFASFDKLRSALATDYVVQQDALQKEGDAVSGGVTLRRK